MAQLVTNSGPAVNFAGLSRPSIVLFNNQQWTYLQRRFQITPRELEITKLVCQGYSNKEIADSLNIKEGTVKIHLRNIYRKTWVPNKMLMLLRFFEDSKGFFGEFGAREYADRRFLAGTEKTLSLNWRRIFFSK